MEQWRYPIGRFEPEDNLTEERRLEWIREIEDLPRRLRGSAMPLTPAQLDTPYRPGGWTVRQVVHHMADNDMNAYIRFKRALTEENPTAGSYREDAWAELADYAGPIEPSLALLGALRERFAGLLRELEPTLLNRTFVSPAHGEMGLGVAMQRYAWHGRHHLAQIESLKRRSGW